MNTASNTPHQNKSTMPLTAFMRRSSLAMRSIAGTVVMTFTMLILQPTVMATQAMAATTDKTPVQSDEGKLSKVIQRIDAKLARMEEKLGKAQDIANDQAELVLMKNELRTLDQAVSANFKAVEDHIVAHNLPDVIKQRHLDAVSSYEAERDALLLNLDAIDQSTTDEERKLKLQTVRAQLKAKKQKRSSQRYDPNYMPFHFPDGKVRKPFEKPAELQQLMYDPKPVQVAAVNLPSGLLATDGTIPLPQPEDTQPNEDVQITPDIQALATSLNNDPVQIYNWVHNNIEFVPTYGTLQGSQGAFESKKANAFDTASLLIALLRAAGIPARYAYGTVQVPADQAMNWVGGVTSPNAALQLLGKGGIPSMGLAEAGVIKHIKLEHVWVEAWVDYMPSRGAKNIQGDTWIPLDASFKQYTYNQGIGLQAAVPFDVQGLVDQITQTAQVNETEGWVRGIDETLVQSTLTNYQTQLDSYLTTNNPNATVGDIVGTKIINPRSAPMLAIGLPYKIIAQTSSLAALPASTRHEFQFKLYATKLDATLDSPLFTYTQTLAQLEGKKMTLAYSPASQADLDLINSYLPEPDVNGNIDPASWPTSLPGYLINLNAELRVEGQIVASSGTFTAGQELFSRYAIKAPGEAWQGTLNTSVAGEMVAISVNGSGVNNQQLNTLRTRIQNTQDLLNQGTGTIEREAYLGDVLYGTALNYFGMLEDLQNIIAETSSDIVAYPLPSFGAHRTALKVDYAFGLPRMVQFAGLVTDMDRLSSAMVDKSGDSDKAVQYHRSLGMLASILEHAVPEQIYSDPSAPTEGVSAAKLLSLANLQGQKIYTIDSSNISTTLPLISVDQDVKDDITKAVNAGQAATVHEANLSVNGWTGAGYILLDPKTGSGAYRISGGMNGGWQEVQGIVGNTIQFWELFDNITMGEETGFAKALGFLGKMLDAVAIATDVQECIKNRVGVAITFLAELALAMAIVAAIEYILAYELMSFTMAAITGAAANISVSLFMDGLRSAICH